MTREIKFRAWDADKKSMLYPAAGIYGFMTYDGSPVILSVHGAALENTSYTLMQFTGLLDKNGKDIYEGDILRPPQSQPPMPKANNENVAVEWNQQIAGFILVRVGTTSVTHGIYRAENSEVVGNIHENADLLRPTE